VNGKQPPKPKPPNRWGELYAASTDAAQAIERHYTVDEIAKLWAFDRDTIRKLFAKEPGVLALANAPIRGKRRYTTLRVPESVMLRVHRRLSYER